MGAEKQSAATPAQEINVVFKTSKHPVILWLLTLADKHSSYDRHSATTGSRCSSTCSSGGEHRDPRTHCKPIHHNQEDHEDSVEGQEGRQLSSKCCFQ